MHLTEHKDCRVTVPETTSGLLLFVFKHCVAHQRARVVIYDKNNINQETACSVTSCFAVNMKSVVSTIPAVIA